MQHGKPHADLIKRHHRARMVVMICQQARRAQKRRNKRRTNKYESKKQKSENKKTEWRNTRKNWRRRVREKTKEGRKRESTPARAEYTLLYVHERIYLVLRPRKLAHVYTFHIVALNSRAVLCRTCHA